MIVTMVTTMIVDIRMTQTMIGTDTILDATLGPEMNITAAIVDITTIIDIEMRGHHPDMEAVDILGIHLLDAQILQNTIQGTDLVGTVQAWIHQIQDIEVEAEVEAGAEVWIDEIAIIDTRMIIIAEEKIDVDPNIGTVGNQHLCHHRHPHSLAQS